VAEVLAEAGFGRIAVRPPAARGAPYRDHPRRAGLLGFNELPPSAETKVAGLLLAVPELVALDLPGIVKAAGYPGTSVIPATNYLLSLLALKLVGARRVSHVDDLAADVGAGLFAGLVALPKATALTTYSYRLDHTRQTAMLGALGKAMLAADLVTDAGGDLDLDFHAIMHWGQDVALEKHYVPRRSQRTRSVLSFFAQDGASQTLVYANADLTKSTQANEVLVFAEHWRSLTGHYPARLVMDQKVTTQTVLGRLDAPSSPCACAPSRSRPTSPPCRPRRGAPSHSTATAPTGARGSSTRRRRCPPTPAPCASLSSPASDERHQPSSSPTTGPPAPSRSSSATPGG